MPFHTEYVRWKQTRLTLILLLLEDFFFSFPTISGLWQNIYSPLPKHIVHIKLLAGPFPIKIAYKLILLTDVYILLAIVKA